MLLEILAHKGLVGEVEFLGYFLDALGTVFEHCAHLKGYITVYPFVGSAFAYQLDGFRQMLGRYAQLVSIPCHPALGAEMCFY